ncbi:tetratricopeptide repeat domain-containing protein [Trichoderma gamsii]|uniref:Tetratricopeptide repeat domain-containing protein n=1 Tax=Trichoderma gamsii TaxID=398673 RepID=A0A2P5A2L1_9HYPO|nr:tetratricopeptide repeat domain-containing protein [Trichoderma gamsii]PON30776.1 tetratricopeptide repeat domain-containing protein [Trichoderma gamsii]
MPEPSEDPELPKPKSTGESLIRSSQDKRYEEGEAHLKKALRIRKALGNYIPRSGEANLSWSLVAQGKLEECNTLLWDSLAGRGKALGKDDREPVRTGLILYSLGNLRAAQDKWDESFEYHQRALRHMLATVGEKDFYTAQSPTRLSSTSFACIETKKPSTGKAQKASIALRVACRLRKEITKEDQDSKTLTMNDFDEIVAFWAR